MIETISVDQVEKDLFEPKNEQQSQQQMEIEQKPTVSKKKWSKNRLNILILLIIAIVLQFFMSTSYFKNFLSKYISNPMIAMVASITILILIVGGLFFILTKNV